MQLARRLASELTTILCVVLLGGFIAAALARYAPGYSSDATDLDARLSPEVREALRLRRVSGESLPIFYLHYLRSMAKGDFGVSESFGQPIGPLLADRIPYTAALVAGGSAGGFLLAVVLAAATLRWRGFALNAGTATVTGMLLAIPPAVLGLAFFHLRAPLMLAMTLILFPRVYGSLRSILQDFFRSDAVIAARARGLSPVVVALRYFLRPAAGKIAALFGTAIVIAFGCAVPIEALCGRPGIGQLTWKAAMSRDLPLLSVLALIITCFVTVMNTLADLLAPEERA